MQKNRNGWWRAVWAMAVAGVAGGCGTTTVTLPRHNRMMADQAVTVIERSAQLNAMTREPALDVGDKQTWADADGWYAVENGRIIKLYYADIESVTRSYAQRGDVVASACVAGLMGPFSGAYVEVVMKDGQAWRLKTDPEGDPAVCLNCAPLWLVTFPRPISKTKRVGESFEFMRVRANLAPPP